MVKQPRKQQQKQPEGGSSRAVYIVGSLVVVALLVFSFRRIASRSDSAPAAPAASTSSAPLPPLASGRESTAPAELHEPQAAEVAHVPRTTPEELLRLYQARQVTILDVRDKDSYLDRHIPGSLHIPLQFIPGEIPYLPKDKPIVAYCT